MNIIYACLNRTVLIYNSRIDEEGPNHLLNDEGTDVKLLYLKLNLLRERLDRLPNTSGRAPILLLDMSSNLRFVRLPRLSGILVMLL